MKFKFKRLSSAAFIPEYAHESDSGMDIKSAESYDLGPMERHTFSTGIACQIPKGYDIQVRPRSGMCAKGVVTMFGTVDQGYRGEIMITLINLSKDNYTVKFGDKIAQLVVSPVVKAHIEVVEAFDDKTDRGEDGFGSTGR